MGTPVTIEWNAPPRLSVIHAAFVVATDARCIDTRSREALVGLATQINTRLLSASVEVGIFWRRLFDEVAIAPGNQRACEIALMHAGSNELQIDQTASAISNLLDECRVAFEKRFPKLADQLQLRSQPLKDRWDTVGPGLLNQVAAQIWTDGPPLDWWPKSVTINLVQPMVGGDGGQNQDAPRIWVEAMLTDADPLVPEVLRIAWLISRVAIQSYIGKRTNHALARAWSLASVPLTLEAARQLDLIQGDPLPIHQAIALWHFGDDLAADVLLRWWPQFQSGEMRPMPIALKALDRMLATSEC